MGTTNILYIWLYYQTTNFYHNKLSFFNLMVCEGEYGK